MNNRGWGFSAFLVLCAILGGALIFAVYIGVNKLNISIENREDTNKTEETVKNEEPKKVFSINVVYRKMFKNGNKKNI